MVFMQPRKQVLPQPQRNLRMEFVAQSFPKSIERPSIIGSNGQGRGVNGEHSNGSNNNGGSDASELWRSINARKKFGTR
jgi:hypothetical protein